LKVQLEAELFLGNKIFEVTLNEEGFQQNFTQDAFNACLDKVSKADIVVILYNGDAGWAPDKKKNHNGICHEEYLIAVQDHPGMTYGINISGYFENTKYNTEQIKRNESFKGDVIGYYRFNEYAEAKSVDQLQDYILRLVKSYIRESSDSAYKAKKDIDRSNTVFGKTLDWSKLNYNQRVEEIKSISEATFNEFEPFKDIIVEHNVIPDNMSVADARNYIKRPYLYEHETIKTSKLKKGVIHIIATYGSATEVQVKGLVGHPDLTVIKTPFGYYLWEQNTHIQIFFITNLKNPSVVKTRMQQVSIWLASSKEESKVQQRSLARFSILKSINDSQKITGIK